MTSQLARHIFLILSPVSSSLENLFVFCDIGPWEHGALSSRHGKGRRSDIVCNVSKPSHGEILCCWISAADIKRESRFASSSDSYNFGHVWQKKKNICTFFKNLPRIYWRNLYVDYKWTIRSTAGFHRRPKLIWVKTRAKMISRFIDRLVNWNWIQLFLKLKCWKTKQNKKKSWLLHLLSFRDLLFVRNIMKTNTFGGILMT